MQQITTLNGLKTAIIDEFSHSFAEEDADKKQKDYITLAAQHLIPQGIDIAPPEIVFEVNGTPMFTKKSISLLIAKAKAGKTTVAAWIIARAIKLDKRVLWIDTEQGLYYASRTQSWILLIAGLKTSNNLSYYDLRIYPPNERINYINAIVESKAWDLVVVDGVRDLVFDVNNVQETTNVATYIMKWAEISNCHILTILHQNKADGNAKGHLGAEMTNKAESVVKISLNERNEIVVESEYSRGKPFDTFALNRNEEGLPYLIEDWVLQKSNGTISKRKLKLPTEFSKAFHIEILQKIFVEIEEMKSSDFLNNFMGVWSVTNPDGANKQMNMSRAKVFRSYYVQQNLLVQLTGQKGNTTVNKINRELVENQELVN